MVFARHLRPLLLIIGAAIGAAVLAQFAIARSAVTTEDSSAKAIGCDLGAPESGEGSDADISGEEPVEEFFIQAPRLDGDIEVSVSATVRLADRRGATLVGVVQLLI